MRLDGSDPVGEALAQSLESGQSLAAMRRCAADAGGKELIDRAHRYVDEGKTDAAEVYRVLGGGPQ